MWNGGWLHLDNHLEKLLEDIFSSKSLFLTVRKDIESLGVALISPKKSIFWCFLSANNSTEIELNCNQIN